MKYCKYLFFVLAACIFSACTKTDVVEPPAPSTSRMLEYKIVNLSGDPIYGVINDAEKSVKVYLPYHLFMNILQPEIKVSEGATVTPGSSTIVDSVLFQVFNPGTFKYKVTGKNGGSTDYTLFVEVHQPDIAVDELSPDAANPVELKASVSSDVKTNVKLTGKNFLQLAAPYIRPEVIFINSAGVEVPMYGHSGVNTSGYNLSEFTFIMPMQDKAAPGLYTVKVRNYAREVTLKNKVKIIAP
ncbi:hypothetical protein [uncultured Chitinophaga sp.]|uniref:hypothetical protein n=1 Tax=uncultured Chitinophaga sp. TaxID=339340 RepID=UPI0025D61667|nr:hypothetical protein [uncultured Chitinophaga sp.]